MKAILAVCASALLLPAAALAQKSDQPSNQNDQQQSQSNSQSSATNQSQSNSAQDQTIEGCVIRQRTAYYITPISGTNAPIRLRGDQDMSTSENHDVRVTGHYQNGSNESATSSGSSQSAQPGTSSSSSSQSGQQPSSSQGSSSASGTGGAGSGSDFIVTKVETVSSTCPPSSGNQSPR